MIIEVDGNILLELVNESHADAIFNLVNENRDYLAEWLPWVTGMNDIEFIKNFISFSQKTFSDKTDYAFVILLEKKIVGRIGLYKVDNQNKIGSIGYWLANEAQGEGIMTKACKALIGHSFNQLGINRIEIKCGTGNHKSQAIPERLGFTKEGIVRQGEAFYDRFIDLYSYSLLKRDWPG
jgi:ribosomal-protein-serine acetyltransferase